MTEKEECFQLVPPHLNRRNSAERAIQTFKNNFIAGLASVNENFPVHIWCRLLLKCLLALNLLCPSRINPKLSSYIQLHGAFDFNRTPLAPPSTKIIIHDKPAIRGSLATQGYEGWYIGLASNHYRCHTVYANHTSHERVADNVEFPTIRKIAIHIIHGKRHHRRTQINTCPPKSFPCLPILKCWRQTNGVTSSNRQTFSTRSNKK